MDRHAWKHVGCIFLIALTARLGAAALWQQRTEGRFYFGDSETYWQLGQKIAWGEDYRYPADGYDALVFRTPGYPLLLAPIFLVGGENPSLFWARAQGAVFGSLAAVAVWRLALALLGSPAALVAGLIAAVYPGAVVTSALVLTETPFSALMLFQLLVWGAAWRNVSRTRAVWLGLVAGGLAGAAVLVRPSWLLCTPAVVGLAWAAWLRVRLSAAAEAPRRSGDEGGNGGKGSDRSASGSSTQSPGRAAPWNVTAPCEGDSPIFAAEPEDPWAKRPFVPRKLGQSPWERLSWNEPAVGVAVLAAMLVVLAPWWIRNWHVTGRFIPTTLQVGASLYDGLSPTATGASEMKFFAGFIAAEREHDAGATDLFEVRLDRRMRREAVEWAMTHPAQATRLALVKIGRMWNIWPNEPSFSTWPVRLVVAGTYVPIMILALVGAWRTFHLGLPYMLCWFPAVYFTLLHAVFVSSIRYREPPLLALIVLAVAAVFGPISAMPSRREGR